ncbi:MAG TPA: hypothetical protein VLD59_20830 [Steroidobacteraceae bacterium]|nr:hypothetical protein [Steroidobacteraceae bacterium]
MSMTLGKAILAFMPRLLIALLLFLVVVCAAICAGLLSPTRASARAATVDFETTSLIGG